MERNERGTGGRREKTLRVEEAMVRRHGGEKGEENEEKGKSRRKSTEQGKGKWRIMERKRDRGR